VKKINVEFFLKIIKKLLFCFYFLSHSEFQKFQDVTAEELQAHGCSTASPLLMQPLLLDDNSQVLMVLHLRK